ncbi:MAG: DUF222 domain-containing protein [bacterium]|nr:DUF222 domain-containing protein [bacterium]MDE0289946.1 DUF222 domain-containing protein [bacterium]MDE0437902.1 DUF222 domain-containing protein [bacterium]
MENEHAFGLFGDTDGLGTVTLGASNGSGGEATDRITAVLGELRQVRIGPMSRSEAQRALGLLSQAQSVVKSLMCEVTRQAHAESDSDRAEILRQGARLPGRESKKMARVAQRLQEMPKVKERFAAGQITSDHVNALANAADKVGPLAVEADNSLIETAEQLPADSFDRHARKWSNEKLIERGVDPLERQRRAREAKLWVEKETGLGVLMAKLPRPQFEHLRQAIDNHYIHHLRRDGADGHDPDEIRTPKQRLADVSFELLTNRSADTGEPLIGTVGVKPKASTQLILVAQYGVVDGTDPNAHVEMIGVGPVPRHILATLSPDTELAGMVFDRAGRPLWLGRNQRLGNAAQRLAVAVRDGGCFECGAPIHRCELHHMQEWHRDRGRTDVDNLVAVCRQHHKWLETNNLIVERTADGYRTRPRTGHDPPR